MASPPGMVGAQGGSYGPVSDGAAGARAEPYGVAMRAAPPAPPAPPPPALPPATMDPATMAPATMAPPTMAPGYEQPQPIQYEQTQPPPATAAAPEPAAVAAVPGAAMTTPAADVMTQLQQSLAAALPAPEAATAAGAVPMQQQYTLATLMPGMGGQYVLAPASAYYGATAAPGTNNAALQQYIAAAYPTLDATQQAALVQYYSQLQVASAQASGGLAGGLATVISGGYPVVATTGPSNAWITNRLIEREKARIEKNYEEADKLRKLLRQNGIEVDDRDRSWTSRDGRRGPRPNHNDPMEEENEAATLVSAMPGMLSGLGAVPAS